MTKKALRSMGGANVLEQTGVIKAKLIELEEFKQNIQ